MDSRAQRFVVAATRGHRRAASPFWSPDEPLRGFHRPAADSEIDAAGGQATTIVDGVGGNGGAWTPRRCHRRPSQRGSGDQLFFTACPPAEAQRLSSRRQMRRVTSRRSFRTAGTSSIWELRNMYVGSIDGPDRTLVLQGAGNAIYAQGYLVFLRETTLYTQRFDVEHFVGHKASRYVQTHGMHPDAWQRKSRCWRSLGCRSRDTCLSDPASAPPSASTRCAAKGNAVARWDRRANTGTCNCRATARESRRASQLSPHSRPRSGPLTSPAEGGRG